VRHEHEWKVWQDVKPPEGTVLIPGVVTHATNLIEHPELIAERIVRLAKLVGRENVLAGTDCGFSQGPFSAKVHPSIQWAKLSALAEGAELATQELWSRSGKGHNGSTASNLGLSLAYSPTSHACPTIDRRVLVIACRGELHSPRFDP